MAGRHKDISGQGASPSDAARGVDMASGEPAFRFLGSLAHGVNVAFTRRDFRAQAKVPATGGALVVANHNSNFDPLVIGDYLIWAGRWPRFLGKAELWKVPVVGFFARGCRQIPVERGTSHAVDSLKAAKDAIDAGEMVAIYPEGTVGTDPEGWPMTARSGAARLALQLRCPVIPVGQWGAQNLLPAYAKVPRLHKRPRVRVLAGPPVDLSPYRPAPGEVPGVRSLLRATAAITADITSLVAQLRGEAPPAQVWNPKVHGQSATGDPRRRGKPAPPDGNAR